MIISINHYNQTYLQAMSQQFVDPSANQHGDILLEPLTLFAPININGSMSYSTHTSHVCSCGVITTSSARARKEMGGREEEKHLKG